MPNYRWGLVAGLLALPTLVPVIVVLASLLNPDTAVWSHLLQEVLPRVVTNTFVLALAVTSLATALGVMLAWFTSVCEFPGRRFFSWALFLPLSIPGYVMAFVYLGWFEYSGPIQSWVRGIFGSSSGFPDIRSVVGVTLTLVLVLFPYPYLLARNGFSTQGKRALEVGQSLGLSKRQSFFRVALPMARPWIVGGSFLVLMETLADFGTVAVFNFDTFTTAIYKSWFGLFSVSGAMQLASLLMLFVLLILLTEKGLRLRKGYQRVGVSGSMTQSRIVLKGWHRGGVFLLCVTTFAVAFVLPMLQVGIWAVGSAEQDLDSRYFGFVTNSLVLGLLGAFLVATASLLLAYSVRLKGLGSAVFSRLATLGYALPGVVLAVGLVVPIAALDKFSSGLNQWTSFDMSFALQGTLIVMLIAYMARFMAVSHAPIESNMLRITPSLEDASKSLGVVGLNMLSKVHLPIVKSGLLTAMTLVFVDIMKELPITLMTRPFGWDTLAVRVFEMTSEGFWERAALPGLAIVLVGLVPVAILISRSDHAT
ncbi:MAG: iron ABC transporter permease [Pseudomonadota bacterium]